MLRCVCVGEVGGSSMANKNGGLWGDEQFCNLHCHWENRGFSVPQIESVSLWEPSAHTAGPDWLLRPVLGCFSLPGWGVGRGRSGLFVHRDIVSDVRGVQRKASGWVGSLEWMRSSLQAGAARKNFSQCLKANVTQSKQTV